MRPLLVLDCDEVVLSFAGPFATWLRQAHDIELRFESFALQGNMRHRADGRLVEPALFPMLFDGFFAQGQGGQRPVEGVVDALDALSADMDIAILTNVPAAYRDIRADVLAGHGIGCPVTANDGPKGPVLKALTEGRRALFVDDLPPQLASAAKHAPDVWRLHMVADATLRALIPAAPDAHARIDRWAEAVPFIRERLLGEEGR